MSDPLGDRAALGWDAGWDAELARALAHWSEGASPDHTAREAAATDARILVARVIAGHRDRWSISAGRAPRPAVLAGALRHRLTRLEQRPTVGDWVLATTGAGLARIEYVLPRRGVLRRRAAGASEEAAEAQVVAANVDVALVLGALVPEPNVRRLERAVAIAWDGGAVPVVVLTKADLHEDPEGVVAMLRAALPGADVLALSSTHGTGLDALAPHLAPGRTAVLIGPSGVGKSTLINRLLGVERLRTHAVREDGKGRHTTTHRELVVLPDGALLIDTPGTRELGLWMDEAALAATFDDIAALAADCRFADCAHEVEPGCAVRAAVETGTLAAERLEHWHKLRRELAWMERKHDKRAAAAWDSMARAGSKLVREILKHKGR